jgi:hypothetical protein
MKTFIAVFLCGIFLTAKADDQIRTVRHGTNITERPSAALATNVIELFQSAGYNSTDYAVKADTWREREQSDSFIVLTLSPPHNLTVCTFSDVDDAAVGTNVIEWGARHLAKRESKPIDTILVPLPTNNLPDYIFAKSGTNVIAVAKFSPFVLKRIVLEPALHLSTVFPYSSLTKLQDP